MKEKPSTISEGEYIYIYHTTGLNNYWISRKCSVLDWHTLYKHWTTLYMHCAVLLTWTVHHWTSLYIHNDSYCTALNSTVRGYWSALYITEQHCTGVLIYTVQNWTGLYGCTDLNCTAQSNTVRGHWSTLYRIEQHCMGFWSTLYSTGQHCTGTGLRVTRIIFFLMYEVSCKMLPIDKN